MARADVWPGRDQPQRAMSSPDAVVVLDPAEDGESHQLSGRQRGLSVDPP